MSYFDFIAHDFKPDPLHAKNRSHDFASYFGSIIELVPPRLQKDRNIRDHNHDIDVRLANARANGESSDSQARHIPSRETTNSNSRPAQILVVEDEGIVALDIKNTLRRLGHHVVAVASTGWDAIHQASRTRPDLVLMDIRLDGEMDGIEAAAYIRQELGISVIFLTAQADESTRKRADSVTPAGYLIKPFSTQDLEALLAVVLLSQGNDQSNV